MLGYDKELAAINTRAEKRIAAAKMRAANLLGLGGMQAELEQLKGRAESAISWFGIRARLERQILGLENEIAKILRGIDQCPEVQKVREVQTQEQETLRKEFEARRKAEREAAQTKQTSPDKSREGEPNKDKEGAPSPRDEFLEQARGNSGEKETAWERFRREQRERDGAANDDRSPFRVRKREHGPGRGR